MQPLLLILGKSGSGKTTLCTELEKRYGLKSIPSYTTRPPRFKGEQGHTFITEDEFNKLQDILAYAETDGCRYAVTEEMINNENYNLYVIDIIGLKYLYEHYHGERPFVSIYIQAENYNRFMHMVNRTDMRTYEEKVRAALNRIEHDMIAFKYYDIKDNVNYVFDNHEGQFDRLVSMVSRICRNYGIIGEDND